MADPKPRRRLTRAARPAIKANAVPRLGDVRSAAVSLSRGRLPDGSLLGTIIRGLTQGGAKIPPSARPIGPAAKANAMAASITSGSDLTQVIGKANRRVPQTMRRATGGKSGFVPTVRLDPSVISDQRRNTPIERNPVIRAAAAAGPRRSGASSSSSGPTKRRTSSLRPI